MSFTLDTFKRYEQELELAIFEHHEKGFDYIYITPRIMINGLDVTPECSNSGTIGFLRVQFRYDSAIEGSLTKGFCIHLTRTGEICTCGRGNYYGYHIPSFSELCARKPELGTRVQQWVDSVRDRENATKA